MKYWSGLFLICFISPLFSQEMVENQPPCHETSTEDQVIHHIASNALSLEAGTVVGFEGVGTLVLLDGRRVGILGIDITGFNQAQTDRALAWLEVFVLDRTVEFRETYKTGFGAVAGVPIWNRKDVVGSLLRIGAVKMNGTGISDRRRAYWAEQVEFAKQRQYGIWRQAPPSVIIRQTKQVIQPVTPFVFQSSGT